VGIADQPRFVNAVVALETRLGPLALLEKLLEIEREFGREREFEVRNGPRTLDLDIELYGDAVMESVALTIPHPRMRERAFVLRPLAEIAPRLREPRSGKTVARLLEELAAEGGLADDAAVAMEG
jgi:2-amino-4-hydroxy-6-hydroxymethyldihydropteridine diphosphokinase